jgi:uncharacterized protein (TIGR03000 family)
VALLLLGLPAANAAPHGGGGGGHASAGHASAGHASVTHASTHSSFHNGHTVVVVSGRGFGRGFYGGGFYGAGYYYPGVGAGIYPQTTVNNSYYTYPGGSAYSPDEGAGGPNDMPPGPNPNKPDDMAHILLNVPAGAEVWFNGAKTSQTGTEREFVSPTLVPGKEYTYEVRVRWRENGEVKERTRTLNVHANDWTRVDLSR